MAALKHATNINPQKVVIKPITSPKVERLVTLEDYFIDNESAAIDRAVLKLNMDSRDVSKAVFILSEVFAKNTLNVTVTQMQWLIGHELCTGCGMVVNSEGKKVLYGFTPKGTQFFKIMFGKNNSPRVIGKREVDGITLIKYALLDEVLL